MKIEKPYQINKLQTIQSPASKLEKHERNQSFDFQEQFRQILDFGSNEPMVAGYQEKQSLDSKFLTHQTLRKATNEGEAPVPSGHQIPAQTHQKEGKTGEKGKLTQFIPLIIPVKNSKFLHRLATSE